MRGSDNDDGKDDGDDDMIDDGQLGRGGSMYRRRKEGKNPLSQGIGVTGVHTFLKGGKERKGSEKRSVDRIGGAFREGKTLLDSMIPKGFSPDMLGVMQPLFLLVFFPLFCRATGS